MISITRRFLFMSMSPNGRQNETVENLLLSERDCKEIGFNRMLADFPAELTIEHGDSVLQFCRMEDKTTGWDVPDVKSNVEYSNFHIRYQVEMR